MQDFLVNYVLPFGIYLIPVTFGLAIVFSLLRTISDPKSALKSIMGMVVIGVVFIIAYSMATADNPSDRYIADNISRLISAGLLTVAFLVILTVASLVLSMIWDFFK